LKFNGGENPDRSVFRVETGEKSIVRSLFSVQQIFDEVKKLRAFLSPEMVPIGNDVGGNRLCISIAGDSVGHVFFWDHEIGKEGPEDRYEPVFFVARSFNEFLDLLTAPELRKVGEIERLGRFGIANEITRFISDGHDIEERNESARTIAQEAARYGNIDVLRACRAHGARMDGAIHLAAMNRSMPAVEYLLSLGVDINELNAQGMTPLALVWDAEFAKLLRAIGARK
jgi:hypothetical protein